MALPAARTLATPVGHAEPRIAPPVPAKALLGRYSEAARDLGIRLMPWQKIAARYMTATAGNRWRYREVCIVVARQNGKTALLLPRILMGLRMGRRMLHTAQNRAIPRETFLALAQLVVKDPDVIEIRKANGQELIRTANGGRYTLVAPRPGVRGFGVDDVFLDEVREQRTFDLLAAIKPTMTASRNPQIVYLSNAGDEDSVVLNALRDRAGEEGPLAYLEWSAAPERAIDDREGWAEANPALGHTIDTETLADNFASLPVAIFETEHLCRWVTTTLPRFVTLDAWTAGEAPPSSPRRPVLGLSMDAAGERASAVIAWQQADGTTALRTVADVTGHPIDVERLGPDLEALARRMRVRSVAHDAWSATLARYLREPRVMSGRDFANASEEFVRLVDAGLLRHEGDDVIGADLEWVTRKPYGQGGWMAALRRPDRPATAVLAAIRAVWLASGPKPPVPRIL